MNDLSKLSVQELLDLHRLKGKEEQKIHNEREEITEELRRRLAENSEAHKQVNSGRKPDSIRRTNALIKEAKNELSKYKINQISHITVKGSYSTLHLVGETETEAESSNHIILASLSLVQSLLGERRFPHAQRDLLFNKTLSEYNAKKKMIILHNHQSIKITPAYIKEVTEAYN
jgi:hypothetical protein